jgi:hypothetical protein
MGVIASPNPTSICNGIWAVAFRMETDSDTFVFGTFANALGFHPVEIEDNAVRCLDQADFANCVGDLR